MRCSPLPTPCWLPTVPMLWKQWDWMPVWDFSIGTGPGEDPGVGLMEEFRSLAADRFVLSLVNTRSLTGKHFKKTETGAVLMSEEGRKIFLTRWQERKQENWNIPFEGKDPLGTFPLCPGSAPGQMAERRSGWISGIFGEVKPC